MIDHLKLFDATVLVGLLNVLAIAMNLFFSFKLKAGQVDTELLKKLETERDLWKLQYNNLLPQYTKLEGELKAYRKLSGDSPIVSE